LVLGLKVFVAGVLLFGWEVIWCCTRWVDVLGERDPGIGDLGQLARMDRHAWFVGVLELVLSCYGGFEHAWVVVGWWWSVGVAVREFGEGGLLVKVSTLHGFLMRSIIHLSHV
jgi:hypothetical protein